MPTISIPLSDEQVARLHSCAEKNGVTPEEFLRERIDEFLAAPGRDFAEAAAFVLEKNQELYRRLE